MGRRHGEDDVSRKRGRPLRRASMADAMHPDCAPRANGLLCRDCPKYGCSWCRVSARAVSARSPACRYGKLLIIAQRRVSKERSRKDTWN